MIPWKAIGTDIISSSRHYDLPKLHKYQWKVEPSFMYPPDRRVLTGASFVLEQLRGCRPVVLRVYYSPKLPGYINVRRKRFQLFQEFNERSVFNK